MAGKCSICRPGVVETTPPYSRPTSKYRRQDAGEPSAALAGTDTMVEHICERVTGWGRVWNHLCATVLRLKMVRCCTGSQWSWSRTCFDTLAIGGNSRSRRAEECITDCKHLSRPSRALTRILLQLSRESSKLWIITLTITCAASIVSKRRRSRNYRVWK